MIFSYELTRILVVDHSLTHKHTVYIQATEINIIICITNRAFCYYLNVTHFRLTIVLLYMFA